MSQCTNECRPISKCFPVLDGMIDVSGSPWLKKMCMEQKTVMTASRKLIVRCWPKRMADMMAVKIVANVLEYFFKIVSAYLHKAQLCVFLSSLPLSLCV